MIVTRRQFLAVGSASLVGQAEPLGAGLHPLRLGTDRDGFLYVPKGHAAGVPSPLVVLLHGAGGSGTLSDARREMADALGVILLLPDSRDARTWDVLLDGFGPDVDFIADALQYTYTRCAVDRRRMALAGVSDGASYALSLGIGTGDVFTRIMAFAPGVMQPAQVRGKPKIFIAHGTRDPVMPIGVTSRTFVARLTKLGYEVTYREYDGGHAVPPEILRAGFDWFLT